MTRYEALLAFIEEMKSILYRKWALYGNNNIYIYASKTILNGKSSIISSKTSVNYDSRIYVFGNDIRKNEVYSSRASNPLYFPMSSSLSLGDEESVIIALKANQNHIIYSI